MQGIFVPSFAEGLLNSLKVSFSEVTDHQLESIAAATFNVQELEQKTTYSGIVYLRQNLDCPLGAFDVAVLRDLKKPVNRTGKQDFSEDAEVGEEPLMIGFYVEIVGSCL